MQGQIRTLEIYVAPSGQQPYLEWLGTLKDKVTKARILNGVTKMEQGNFGVSESVGGGVEDGKIILLLLGGSKSGQQKDIQQSKLYLNDYRSRNDD